MQLSARPTSAALLAILHAFSDVLHASSDDTSLRRWGTPPWIIDFTPRPALSFPQADFAVVGAGFAGLAAAAWLRLARAGKIGGGARSGRIGCGASGRTGGMALAETAAGDLPGLGDVLAGFKDILGKLGRRLRSRAAGRVGDRPQRRPANSPISWKDSGTLRVMREVPGGTLDPGKLVSGLARAAHRLGASISRKPRGWNSPLGRPGRAEIAPGCGLTKQLQDLGEKDSVRDERSLSDLSGLRPARIRS